jgi:hypothetical protein
LSGNIVGSPSIVRAILGPSLSLRMPCHHSEATARQRYRSPPKKHGVAVIRQHRRCCVRLLYTARPRAIQQNQHANGYGTPESLYAQEVFWFAVALRPAIVKQAGLSLASHIQFPVGRIFAPEGRKYDPQ